MDDLISRQKAIDAIEKTKTARSEDNELYVGKINAQMAIMQLPSAEPQERTGKWIYWIGKDGFKRCKCSECNTSYGCIDTPYCPNCGAHMIEEDEETDE